MKKVWKIILAVLSLCSFLWMVFWIATFHIDGLSYLYHSKNVVISVFVCCSTLLLLLALIVAIIVMMFKSKETIRVVSTVILYLLIPVSLCGSFISMACFILTSNGCSYTEDMANYRKYDDRVYEPSHFPQSITQDMTVVDFTYYYKYADREHTDIYLEVKFDDKETMEKYLTEAKETFSEEGVVEYPNPYNSKYTDVIKRAKYPSGDLELNHNRVYFGSHEQPQRRYVDIDYSSITYSYDELTIIYNYTDMGSDIFVGNDPDKGYYYPKILARFGVEWQKDGRFDSKEVVGNLAN